MFLFKVMSSPLKFIIFEGNKVSFNYAHEIMLRLFSFFFFVDFILKTFTFKEIYLNQEEEK